jgi:hypothetical protein
MSTTMGRAQHDGHVGDVEDPGSNRADAYIQEIEDASTNSPIDPVRGAAGDEQRQADRGPALVLSRRYRMRLPNDSATKNP